MDVYQNIRDRKYRPPTLVGLAPSMPAIMNKKAYEITDLEYSQMYYYQQKHKADLEAYTIKQQTYAKDMEQALDQLHQDLKTQFFCDHPAEAMMFETASRDMNCYQAHEITDAYTTLVTIVKTVQRAELEKEPTFERVREHIACVSEEISQTLADGWRLNPMTDGCGGSIAASNTGIEIARMIRTIIVFP